MKLNESQIFTSYEKGDICLNQTLEYLSLNKGKSNKDRSIKPFNEPMRSFKKELEELIGLEEVKALLNEIQAFTYIQQKRLENQLNCEPVALHMIFKGNPGTGKTTVARIVGQMFKEMGILKEGQLIEIDRSDLVGEYIGHTALKVKKELQKALGGVLFIDEAYSLARGGEKDFGKEAIDYLVKAMEDYKDELILILAGYSEEMDIFLEINPGLRSRFPIVIEFTDYSIDELIKIAYKFIEHKEYMLSDQAVLKLRKTLLTEMSYRNSGNARLVRNILEKSFRKQALRLHGKRDLSKDELMLIQAKDI